MHVPVLLNESIDALEIKPEGVYVDATFGGGGHSKEIISYLSEGGKLLAFDQDAQAAERLIGDERVVFINENFRHIQRFTRFHGFPLIDGVLADLGMSSFQLDSQSRGFSTRFDAPLDMRMDQSKSITAAQILNEYNQKELQTVFQEYGELRNARSLAKHIVEERKLRPFDTTGDFIERIDSLIRGNKNRYLAQVFQSLRIEVNEEMEVLKEFLTGVVEVLKPGGRIAVITFHSLEDRLVKRFFKTGTFDGVVKKDLYGNFEKPLIEITKKPVEPTEDEIKINKRSRSAKLRVAMKPVEV